VAADADVVYTHYPGYVSYVYGGCVARNGWYYLRGQRVYYLLPTWGFASLEPWTGWGRVSCYGPVTITVGFGGYGGAAGTVAGHPRHYGATARPGAPLPPAGEETAGSRPGGPRVTPYNNNLYASQKNRDRNAAAPKDKSVQTADRAARGSDNNVYASQNGDVYRRNDDGSCGASWR
jgi:hypothetical protein